MSLVTAEALDKNLTEWELLALNSKLNVSDGHPRQSLTPGQAQIITDLPTIFKECSQEDPAVIERAAVERYLSLVHQNSYPRDSVLLCYASSVAMEILARALTEKTRRCALLHPTFDNIPDLLRGNGLELIPVGEEVYESGSIAEDVMNAVGCVFLTTPNNPTGKVLEEAQLTHIAAQCRDADVVLALDTCFRSFDSRAQYDHYRVLEESGCRWVVIEDTGKIWPMHELKVGMLVHSANIELELARIHSDILLAVSPVIMRMVDRLAQEASVGGLSDLQAHIADNRKIVQDVLTPIPEVSFPYRGNSISVEVVDLGDRRAQDIWKDLSSRNVFLLPCEAFYWNRPEGGAHQLRISLARDSDLVLQATQALREVLVS